MSWMNKVDVNIEKRLFITSLVFSEKKIPQKRRESVSYKIAKYILSEQKRDLTGELNHFI